MHHRLVRILVIATAAAALAAAAIAVNFVLLRYADSRSDPVGKLTPRATLTQPPSSPATTEGGEREREERDD